MLRLNVRVGRPRTGGPGCSDFDALDGEALEIGARIFRVEDLAVEKGFLAARRRSRNIGGGDAERFSGVAPDVLAVDLVDHRPDVGGGFEFAPANVLGDEPGVVALERIRRVVAPELHVLLRALFNPPIAVVDVTLGAADNV